jgi:primosomal protein N'
MSEICRDCKRTIQYTPLRKGVVMMCNRCGSMICPDCAKKMRENPDYQQMFKSTICKQCRAESVLMGGE